MPSSNEKDKKINKSPIAELSGAYRKAAPYINSVYVLFAATVVVGLIGWYLDKLFITKPIFTILGLVLGMGVGFYSFFKGLPDLDKKE